MGHLHSIGPHSTTTVTGSEEGLMPLQMPSYLNPKPIDPITPLVNGKH
jgi:hypothetical protein